jgi:hypothetical protein
VSRQGSEKRRYLRGFHAFILGIPLVEVRADNSPMVVWERSHAIVRDSFLEHFGDTPAEHWPEIEITRVYRNLRRIIFDSCRRVAVCARPGEAWLVHRLALHGLAPWQRDDSAASAERRVIFFRPELLSPMQWLHAA